MSEAPKRNQELFEFEGILRLMSGQGIYSSIQFDESDTYLQLLIDCAEC